MSNSTIPPFNISQYPFIPLPECLPPADTPDWRLYVPPKYPCWFPHEVWYGVHGAALTGTALSLIGSAFIIVSVIQERIRKKKSLKFAEMLPLLLVVTDLVFNFSHGVDHLAAVITRDVPHGAACQYFAWGLIAGLNMNAFMHSLAAIYVFFAIFFSKQINWGRYFWIAYAIGFGIPIIIATVPLGLGLYLDTGLFCEIKNGIPAHWVAMLPQFVSVALCFSLYIAVYVKIYMTTNELKSLKVKGDKQHNKLTRKGAMLIGYAAMYVIQWGQITVLQIMLYAGHIPGVTFPISALIAAVLFSNSGGAWTAIRYFQIMQRKRLADSKSSSMDKFSSASRSFSRSTSERTKRNTTNTASALSGPGETSTSFA
ncbi:hypothetical protein HK102_010807 [Quaeritorhiza haematococci]|nr:hypothetical protein HK102_010807 [Quaeritorhiza haematococci]